MGESSKISCALGNVGEEGDVVTRRRVMDAESSTRGDFMWVFEMKDLYPGPVCAVPVPARETSDSAPSLSSWAAGRKSDCMYSCC